MPDRIPFTDISNILDASLNGIRNFSEVQNAIGRPILTPGGMTVIPVSRVSVGCASGGVDLPAKKNAAQDGFGGGGGSGVSVTPIAFLTISADDTIRLIPVEEPQNSSIGRVADLIEQAPEIAAKIKKAIFG